ncbi:type II toxin-antitoxin system VapC family toxin [Nocardioides bruguierae]|uniref:PIN domain-containing protein n=1 Tax=Nocardioides bruguierae TaxID=2945102 RepID=A0A9X2D5X5_9ACTN|nr:PIN domain-containing protein [Nocardioides bruguierae]MCM0619442.1 PIN domain-containing protein [Nocardioides bruguierae]
MNRPESPTRVYLDACCLISLVKDEPSAAIVERVLESATTGGVTLIASTMLLVEARGRGRKQCSFDPLLEEKLLAELSSPHWTYVELDRLTALKSRELALEWNFSNADAVHLASAIVGEAEVLMTLNTKDFPVGVEIEGVYISKPYVPGGADLFTEEPDDD